MPETLFTEKQFRDSVTLIDELKRRGEPIDAVHTLIAALVIVYKMQGQIDGTDDDKINELRYVIAQFWGFIDVDRATGTTKLREPTA